MGTLIDASVLTAAERGDLDLERLLRGERSDEAPVALAAITASELLHGVYRLPPGVRRARAELFVNGVLAELPVIPFDMNVARVHATLGAELRARGTTIGAHDLIIAATAVSLGYDVAARDLRSFPKIRGLELRRW